MVDIEFLRKNVTNYKACIDEFLRDTNWYSTRLAKEEEKRTQRARCGNTSRSIQGAGGK